MRLQGKVAIVTGAATGIGKGIATVFAQEGAAVVVDYVGSPDAARETVGAITNAGGKAIAVAADVSKAADVDALISSAVTEFGRLDIMVNNAGVEKKMPFLETPEDYWDLVVSINLKGPFLCAKAAANQMVKQGGGGRIINTSSIHEDLPMPTNAPYCATKGGLRMLTRTICLELAPYGITVNNIGPGAIDTPMDVGLKQQPELYQRLLHQIPLGRMGQPEEVARLAVFLASDDGAYVTGATYFIDGGMMRQASDL